jgi:RNA polymerase sigma-70 factor (ECF subfamily)
VTEDFADFYRSTFGLLAAYAWSLTEHDLADEFAQEALTRVYARWPVVRHPRSYAYQVVTNLVRDRWRSGHHLLLGGLDEFTGTTPGPDTGTLDAVRRLPLAQREVVLLHYYADLPVEAVAHVLQRPVGTVKRRLFDARRTLATALEGTR